MFSITKQICEQRCLTRIEVIEKLNVISDTQFLIAETVEKVPRAYYQSKQVIKAIRYLQKQAFLLQEEYGRILPLEVKLYTEIVMEYMKISGYLYEKELFKEDIKERMYAYLGYLRGQEDRDPAEIKIELDEMVEGMEKCRF